MKKIIISIVVIVVLVVTIVVAIGVVKKENEPEKVVDNSKIMSEVSGTYVGQYCKFVGDLEKNEDEEFSLVLNADGTGKHNRDEMSFDVTWKIDGDKFSMSETFVGDPIEYVGTLKDSNLHIFNGEPENALTYEYVYEKK